MRILHLTHQYVPEYVGGVELYTQSLAAEQAAAGHAVAVFYRVSRVGQGCAVRADGDVQVWAAWDGVVTPPRRFLAAFHGPALEQAWTQALATFRPDLIHIQHLMGLPLRLARLIRQRGIPYVVTLHDYWWVCANAQLITNDRQQICDGPRVYLNCARCALARAGRERWWPTIPALLPLLAARNAGLRRILAGAHAVIAPSQFVCHWYAAHGGWSGDCQAIPLGVERPAAPLPARTAGPVRFAYLGGIAWQKGVHVIVEAFRALEVGSERESPVAELWIAGDETTDPAYTRHLRALATPHVRFLGRLSRAGVWEMLAQADVLLVPSLWYESFGLVVREAFVVGTPVIVSDLGALAEAVREGVDGLRVPPGDVGAWRTAMARFIHTPTVRESFQKAIAPPLTLREHLSQIMAVYARVNPPAPAA